MPRNAYSALSVELSQAHFALSEGRLLKLNLAGLAKPVTSVFRSGGAIAGRCLVTLAGHRYSGADIAWALHTGCRPLHHITLVNTDPLDFSFDNLVPIRTERLKFRATVVGQGVRHPLSPVLWANEEVARKDWEEKFREYYAADKAYVMEQEKKIQAMHRPAPVQQIRQAKRAPYKPRAFAHVPKPRRPLEVEGRTWCWFEGQWLSVPLACHPADDLKLRCRAVLAGALTFEFDKVAERVRIASSQPGADPAALAAAMGLQHVPA